MSWYVLLLLQPFLLPHITSCGSEALCLPDSHTAGLTCRKPVNLFTGGMEDDVG